MEDRGFSGSFELEAARSLAKLSHPTSQQYLRPDVFDQQGTWYRLIEVDGKQVAVKAERSGMVSWWSSDVVTTARVVQQIERLLLPICLPQEATGHLPAALADHFIRIAPLVHIASASLGEAVIKAILRQVITASHARKLLNRFIVQFGQRQTHNGTAFYGFPSLYVIANLSVNELTSYGFGFKAKVIPNVARTILEAHLEERVDQVPSDAALTLLLDLKGVGNWSARVALCDLMGDWFLYPFEDLAVKTWATRLWPEGNWPMQASDFCQAWQERNGHYTSIITFYLLSLGPLGISL